MPPQALGIVKDARLLREDMHQVIAEIHQHPLGIRESLDTHRIFTGLLQLLADLLANRLNLTRIRSGADDEEIGERSHLAQVEYPDVDGFLRFGGAYGSEPGRCLRWR